MKEKEYQEKLIAAHALGFVAGFAFAHVLTAAIILPGAAMHLAGKKHAYHGPGPGHCHHGHHSGYPDHPHHGKGPAHFLAEERAQQLKDEHALLVDIKNDLAEIKTALQTDQPAGPPPPPEP
ncbi:hypothetical protein LFYK43_22260 [Ligilactobacillus salitolerans]|uniref:Uncharacterized protein n=1 Tax=Ligilactobacillus salitolerans TaxID=1808352 RepID=A0A401IW92_9LACO|nr:hypothetical protein [Ligilactobacillus salitolerans]GBG95767.1 hypothetical protein LFYK43_22260 [Ligilactobacillus salitolerans]